MCKHQYTEEELKEANRQWNEDILPDVINQLKHCYQLCLNIEEMLKERARRKDVEKRRAEFRIIKV